MKLLSLLTVSGWFVFCVLLAGCHSSYTSNYRLIASEPVVDSVEPVQLKKGAPTKVADGYGDSIIALDLSSAISMALKYSPLIHRSEAAVGEQVATVQLRKSNYWPIVDAAASTNKIGKEVTYPGEAFGGYALRARNTNASLSITWILYDSGLRGAQLDSAMSMLDAARLGQSDVRRSVISDTISAYYKAEFSGVASKAFEVLENVARHNADAARERVNAGAGSVADQLLTASSYAQTKLKTLEAQSEERRAVADLAAIIGMPRGTRVKLPLHDTEYVDFHAFNGNIHALMDSAVKQHPRVQSVLSQLAAVQYDVQAAQVEGMPVLSLVGSTYQTRTPPQESTVEQKVRGWSVGLQLKIPLFDGFTRRHTTAIANARLAAKEAEVRETVMDVEDLIWNAYLDVRMATDRARMAQELRSVSLEALEVAQGRYQAGVGPITELLQAQGDVAEGTRQYVQAGADWYSARMRLANSVGRLEVIE